MGQMIPTPDRNPQTFLPPRGEYAQITDLATRLAGTDFVPSSLQGNPPAVMAAMLTGRELGLGPMESLRSIHMIEGRPSLSAEAAMRLALDHGHDLWVDHADRESATVKYRRAGWPEDRVGEVTFDLEDADLAGLTGRAMYRKYPRAMLRSRAITEACREGGLLAGAALAYTSEELGAEDETVVVESISPDEADEEYAVEVEDDLEVRRALHKRAAVAYRSLRAIDEERAAVAWTSCGAGLGDQMWRDADVEVLEIRVADLERAAEQAADEQDDEDDEGDEDGGEPEPDPAPEPEPGSDDAEPEPEPEPETSGDCQVPPFYREEMAAAAEEAEAEPSAEALLEEHYPSLNVTDLSALLRKSQTDVDGRTLVLPREGVGGVFAAYEQIERLEREHHDPPRKTVLGALESAGWTPRGRERLAAARQRAEMGEDDEAAMAGPDEVRAAQSASEGRPVGDLLDDFGHLLAALEGEARHRARLKLGELISAAEDGVPEQAALAALVDEMDADASW